MNIERRVVGILRDNYSLEEMIERFEASTEDLADGLDVYVDNNFEQIVEILKEDLFLMDV